MKNILNIFNLIFAIMMAVYFVQAVPHGLKIELNDDDKSGPDGGIGGLSIGDLWGTGDVLDDGLSNLVEPRTATCTGMKDKTACKTCCEESKRAHSFSVRPSLKLNWGVCTCYRRITPRS